MDMLLDYVKTSPEAIKALAGLNAYTDTCSISPALRRLIEIIVSRINGCSYCIKVHEQQARDLGESDARITGLLEWQTSDAFSEKEKLAFRWAENITTLASTDTRDEIFEHLTEYYSEKEIVDLAFIALSMNAWNRIAISFRHEAEFQV